MRLQGANFSSGSRQLRASYAQIAASTAIRIASRLPKNARAETAGSGTSSRPLPSPTRKTKRDSPLPILIACSCWIRTGRFLRRSAASANQGLVPAPFPFLRRSNPLPNLPKGALRAPFLYPHPTSKIRYLTLTKNSISAPRKIRYLRYFQNPTCRNPMVNSHAVQSFVNRSLKLVIIVIAVHDRPE